MQTTSMFTPRWIFEMSGRLPLNLTGRSAQTIWLRGTNEDRAALVARINAALGVA